MLVSRIFCARSKTKNLGLLHKDLRKPKSGARINKDANEKIVENGKQYSPREGKNLMSLSKCPSCGFNEKESMFTGSHFYIYKCLKCQYLFCYECKGSNTARQCPKCESKDFFKYEIVHLM
jgi:Zn ribbon nucleic-acid-binding protein